VGSHASFSSTGFPPIGGQVATRFSKWKVSPSLLLQQNKFVGGVLPAKIADRFIAKIINFEAIHIVCIFIERWVFFHKLTLAANGKHNFYGKRKCFSYNENAPRV
jgi:hypothetical protein